MNEIRLYHHELESMPEYSRSVPSGPTLFKMWKRFTGWHGEPWVVGQYVPPHRTFKELDVMIRWYRVVLRHGPMPPTWQVPDWGNFQRFARVGFGK
jgi:hypothetical protein